MTTTNPERRFRRGLELLARRRYADASVQFHAAIFVEDRQGALRPQMRYRSYYGLSRALSNRPTLEDVKLCEQAAAADNYDPVLLLNLGKVYLRAGKTTRALLTLERGLRLEPGHAELRALHAEADRRAKPVLPGIGRNHALNRSLGRLRSRLTRPKHP
jgi:tetratricopeptide (TPR) repeat protein